MRLPLVRVDRLLLHHLEDSLACVRAVIGIAVDGDCFLQRSDVVLPVNVDARATLLRDLANGAALSADDGADHVALDEQTQREVGLAPRTGARHARILTPIPRRASLLVQRLGVQLAALELDPVQATRSSARGK